MSVEEICRKLKPVIGKKADRYWLAYLSQDYRGKQETEIALNLLAAQLLGTDVAEPQILLTAPPEERAAGDYRIGRVVYAGRGLYPFGLREPEWIQHAALFGRSGAGKTNTVMVILENFLLHRKPFMIFDWKRNYRDLLSVVKDEILVYTVGRQTVPFVLNPLIPPTGTDAAVWLKKLIEIIAHAYYLGEGVMFLLQEAIHGVYKRYGVYNRAVERFPTFDDVLAWLEEHPVKGRKALWMDSAVRGIKSICFGHMGRVVNTPVQTDLGALLEKNVILELDGLTNADKTLIVESMLLWIHHYRLSQRHRETFKHALVIEEAHHILLKRTGGSGGEAITDTILREIRELGEAIVLVDQHPSLISIPALGNTYMTLTMNLKHRSDVNAVGAAMLLADEERDLLGRLPIGAAVVKLQGRWLRPFMIEIPHRNIQKGAMDDAALIQLMASRNPLRPDRSVPGPVEAAALETSLSGDEKRFLASVIEHPFYGTVERYRHLGVSRRRGNAVRASCVEKGLIATRNISMRSGKLVLVDLTGKGRTVLRRLNHPVPDRSRWGGLEHEYWKHKIAEAFRSAGWRAEIEVPVNGYTDIVVETPALKVAVEIETGKSDWQANLSKNQKKGFAYILIVATNDAAHHQINEYVRALKDSQILVISAQELLDRLEKGKIAALFQ